MCFKFLDHIGNAVSIPLKKLLPPEIAPIDFEDDFKKPSEEEIAEIAEKTRKALEAITKTKISASLPVRCAEKPAPAQYLRYTPSNQSQESNSGANQRVIRMIEVQKDPLEPPRFKINKKIPQAPPSPPAPVVHSPTRKLTVKEQQEWKIPPCISNWKNAKGYTIPLDKRLAADGRGLQQAHVNERFAKLAEALYIADRKAREQVEMRAQMKKKLAQKEKEKKEEHLRQLAQKAREERAGIKVSSSVEVDDDIKEREQIRYERHKERQRERNIQRAAPEKRSKLERQRERDISEQIALGLANPRASANEVQFDERLFNQSKGIASGFGDDEDYAVYDRPWKTGNEVAQTIYRPRGNWEKETYGDELEDLASTSKFVPDKGFEGTDRRAKRDGPVVFEKTEKIVDKTEEEDPFGLDVFLKEAKKASKRTEDEADYSNRSSYKRKHLESK